MNDTYFTHTFPNGIRLVHKQVLNTQIAHCGFVLDIGSRDEKEHQQGIAHFWEHMVFKGTQKRKSYHILNRLEIVGGELNAFTTKEKICFHASLLKVHFEKAVELLTDITFHSVFPEKQIKIERDVILEEMAMYRDSPEDAIQDDFDNIIFNGHPLGYNILGTQSSVSKFSKEDFLDFINDHLDTSRVVFSSVSALPFPKVLKIVGKYLKDIPTQKSQSVRLAFDGAPIQTLSKKQAITQAHCAIGREAFPMGHDMRLPFFVLNNLLGGPNMTSRLNLNLREKLGYVYAIESICHSFSDTGLWGIYFGTEAKKLEKAIKNVFREMEKLKSKALGSLQLHHIKEQVKGQLAMAEENNLNFMLMMGKSLIDKDRIESLEEIYKNIDQLDSDTLLEVANLMFEPKSLSMLCYLPE